MMIHKHIHSRRVMKLLEDKGHKVIGTEKNKIIPKLDIYLFEETPSLLNDLTKITIQLKQQKIK